ncbi:unnamed protein product [Cylicostephanus goldi]|uniref:Uncharacterized protein n=1 Tax=Cylicostephanus goldi TaxID=71465 RepID=A0A3P6SWE9_CYLGO|nr:unnamed protein product [Cylicostephanus goldi]
MAVFLGCWCVKQKRIQEQRQYNYGDNAAYTNKGRVASVGSLDDGPQLTQRFPARTTPATLEPARLTPASSRPQSRNLFGFNTSV